MSESAGPTNVSEAPSVVLVGVDEVLAPQVRRELLNYPIDLAAEYRDCTLAVESLREHQRTRRVIVTRFRSEADEAGLRRLNSVLAGWPVVALVDIDADPENLFRANRAGAAQLVPLPLQPSDFRSALDAVVIQFDLRSQAAETIVFSAASSGCGGSTLAATTAHEFATQLGKRTVLIELVSQMGALATNLNLTPKATLDTLLNSVDRLDLYMLQNALTPVGDNLLVLPGPAGLMAPGWLRVDAVRQLVDLARRLAGVVILDLHPTFDDLHFGLIDTADHAVLITQQNIAAIRSLRLLLDNLRPNRAAGRTHLVLNMYDPEIHGLAVSDIEHALGVSGIRTIPRDTPAMLAAMNRGQPLRLVAPHSPVLKAVGGLVQTLRGGVTAKIEESSGLFSRLIHAFRG